MPLTRVIPGSAPKTLLEPIKPRKPNTGQPRDKRVVERYCKAVKRNGMPCQKYALLGTDVCKSHGGGLPLHQTKNKHAKLVAGLARFVKPIAADDWEADPINSFEMDFRRTVAHIRYFDEKIAELANDRDLVYGLVKREIVDGYSGDGPVATVTDTYAAQVNLFYASQLDERKHLHNLHKLWISAKLDEQRLHIAEQTVLMLNDAITMIVRGLGKDVNDPEVRQVVRMALVAIPGVEQLQIEG